MNGASDDFLVRRCIDNLSNAEISLFEDTTSV